MILLAYGVPQYYITSSTSLPSLSPPSHSHPSAPPIPHPPLANIRPSFCQRRRIFVILLHLWWWWGFARNGTFGLGRQGCDVLAQLRWVEVLFYRVDVVDSAPQRGVEPRRRERGRREGTLEAVG